MYYIIADILALSVFSRKDKVEKKRKIRPLTIFLITLAVLLGLGVIATAIAVPIHLLSASTTSASTTTGKQLSTDLYRYEHSIYQKL